MKDFDLSAFLADLRTLCAIDSGHFNAPGTAAVADFFESRYRALGLEPSGGTMIITTSPPS